MSSSRLSYLIAEFPQEKDTINRLSELIDKQGEGDSVRILPPERIFSIIKPQSFGAFLSILDSLVSKKLVKRIIRVESTAGGGIGPDFDSIADIPETMEDFRTGKTIEVDIDQIKIYYEI